MGSALRASPRVSLCPVLEGVGQRAASNCPAPHSLQHHFLLRQEGLSRQPGQGLCAPACAVRLLWEEHLRPAVRLGWAGVVLHTG